MSVAVRLAHTSGGPTTIDEVAAAANVIDWMMQGNEGGPRRTQEDKVETHGDLGKNPFLHLSCAAHHHRAPRSPSLAEAQVPPSARAQAPNRGVPQVLS
mmetsp:Transcript_2258/g.7201  ORF Transcript_2258/g.7201 Transcript_2258/m.7201 type:complete len:99 (-) Transcript_2258:2074-2370(-)